MTPDHPLSAQQWNRLRSLLAARPDISPDNANLPSPETVAQDIAAERKARGKNAIYSPTHIREILRSMGYKV